MNVIVFGPEDPIIWALGPLGKESMWYIVYTCRAVGLECALYTYIDALGLCCASRLWSLLQACQASFKRTNETAEAVVEKLILAEDKAASWFQVVVGIYRGYIGIMEKNMETTIQGLGF